MSVFKDDGVVVCKTLDNNGQLEKIAIIEERQVVGIELDLCNDPNWQKAKVHLESGQTVSLQGTQVQPFLDALNWTPDHLVKTTKKKGKTPR